MALPPINTKNLGESFWSNALKGLETQKSLLGRESYSWTAQDQATIRENQSRTLQNKVWTLSFDDRPLMDRLYLTGATNLDYAQEYWGYLKEHILVAKTDDLWVHVEEELRSCLSSLFRSGYIMGRLLGETELSDQCLKAAVEIGFRRLSEGQFTKATHEKGGEIDEDYLWAGSEMMRLWLLNDDPHAAEQLWKTRMFNVGKSIQKIREYRLFESILALTQLAIEKTPTTVADAERKLLTIQLTWLKWFVVDDPVPEIRIMDLVIGELLFQKIANGVDIAVQDAIRAQHPEEIRKRYERLR